MKKKSNKKDKGENNVYVNRGVLRRFFAGEFDEGPGSDEKPANCSPEKLALGLKTFTEMLVPLSATLEPLEKTNAEAVSDFNPGILNTWKMAMRS